MSGIFAEIKCAGQGSGRRGTQEACTRVRRILHMARRLRASSCLVCALPPWRPAGRALCPWRGQHRGLTARSDPLGPCLVAPARRGLSSSTSRLNAAWASQLGCKCRAGPRPDLDDRLSLRGLPRVEPFQSFVRWACEMREDELITAPVESAMVTRAISATLSSSTSNRAHIGTADVDQLWVGNLSCAALTGSRRGSDVGRRVFVGWQIVGSDFGLRS